MCLPWSLYKCSSCLIHNTEIKLYLFLMDVGLWRWIWIPLAETHCMHWGDLLSSRDEDHLLVVGRIKLP